MENMLDAAARDHVAVLAATTHYAPGLQPWDAEKYAAHLEEARAYCREKGHGIQIYSGAEIMYSPAAVNALSSLPTLGGTEYLLMEFLPDAPFDMIERATNQMGQQGYIPILAHVERYHNLTTAKMRGLKKHFDVRFQVNCQTILHHQGFFRDRAIHGWFSEGLIDLVASDAHNCQSRPTCMSAGYQALKRLYGPEYAGHLTSLMEIEVP